MKYEKPTIDIAWFDMSDVVHTSLTGESGGSGGNIGGDGSQPWE